MDRRHVSDTWRIERDVWLLRNGVGQNATVGRAFNAEHAQQIQAEHDRCVQTDSERIERLEHALETCLDYIENELDGVGVKPPRKIKTARRTLGPKKGKDRGDTDTTDAGGGTPA